MAGDQRELALGLEPAEVYLKRALQAYETATTDKALTTEGRQGLFIECIAAGQLALLREIADLREDLQPPR